MSARRVSENTMAYLTMPTHPSPIALYVEGVLLAHASSAVARQLRFLLSDVKAKILIFT